LKNSDLTKCPARVKNKPSIIGTILTFCLAIGSSIGLSGCFHPDQPSASKNNSIHQYSTLSALLEGVYDGEMTVGELKQQGNFGIGTFNALDGELILFEGHCYKATSDSRILTMADSVKTPFAAICNFHADTTIRVSHPTKIKSLENYLDSALSKPNLIYAYQITGKFDSVVIRSVPKQEKPYKRLIEAYKKQGVFTFVDQQGTLIGYKFPKYLKEVNMDAYHFHFLSSDKTKGGHLLNCILISGEVSVAYIRNYTLQLPNNDYFNHTVLTNNKTELKLIEGADR